MFELPGPWIAGVNLHDVHRMRRELIDRYGFRSTWATSLPVI